MGKQATPTFPATSATRAGQIGVSLGYPRPSTQTPWKIQRPVSWGQTSQTNSLSGRSQEALFASNGFNIIHVFASKKSFLPSTELLLPFWQSCLSKRQLNSVPLPQEFIIVLNR